MGRPRKELDWKDVDKLCGLWATEEEVAAWFECSVDTVARRCKEMHGTSFAEYSSEKRRLGNIALRRKQRQVALKGNVTMLIWLGKQYLGQRDKRSLETSGNDGGPICVKAEDLSDDELAAIIKG